MTQAPTNLFDLAEAGRRRDQAIGQVERHADVEWKREALDAVRYCCLVHDEFIVDDCWKYVGKPSEARAMGAVMKRAKKLGYCEETDRFKASAQPKCHKNPRRIWKSLLANGVKREPQTDTRKV